MDVRCCDRCGKQFRLHRTLDRIDIVTSLVQAGVATSQDQPRLPSGLKEMNKTTLPVVVKDGSLTPGKESYALYESDLCAQCVVDLTPIVSKWLAEKRPK